jgi:chemotaxis family two-component system response regulator Rcp1
MSDKNIELVEILLVEDNPGDVRLTKEALKEYKIINNLSVVMDGEKATDFLFKKGEYKNAPTPDIILLDLNLPKKDGREVLAEIKNDEKLRTIPVIVLSTSESDLDISSSYYNHANCYITKPVDFDNFIEVVKTLQNFWVSVVKLPAK